MARARLMQSGPGSLLRCRSLAAAGWLAVQNAGALACSTTPSQRCSYASSGEGGGADATKPRLDLGGRHATRLAKTHPHLLERMRVVLGYYQSANSAQGGTPVGAPGAPITSVTLNLLQTLKHLNLPDQLKQRLMAYKVLSLNREAEQAHAATLHYLADLDRATDKAPSKPAGLARLLAQRKAAGDSKSAAE